MQASQIAAKAAELRTSNPRQVLGFDPGVHALVSRDALHLVRTYAVPVAYEPTPLVQPEGFAAYRIFPSAQCARPTDPDPKSPRVVDRIRDGSCVLRAPERPAHGLVQVSKRGDREIWKRHWRITEEATEIVSGGAVLGAFRTASAWRLPALPWLLVGCGLNSSAPAWSCFADLHRSLQMIDGMPEDVDRALQDSPESVMLGLRRRPAAAPAAMR